MQKYPIFELKLPSIKPPLDKSEKALRYIHIGNCKVFMWNSKNVQWWPIRSSKCIRDITEWSLDQYGRLEYSAHFRINIGDQQRQLETVHRKWERLKKISVIVYRLHWIQRKSLGGHLGSKLNNQYWNWVNHHRMFRKNGQDRTSLDWKYWWLPNCWKSTSPHNGWRLNNVNLGFQQTGDWCSEKKINHYFMWQTKTVYLKNILFSHKYVRSAKCFKTFKIVMKKCKKPHYFVL